jgi:guanyl-specific ribonuclease Sa
MRNKILAVAAISAAIGAPLAAQAQSGVTVGTTGGTVIVGDAAGIESDQRTAFREYVVRERVPDYRIQERVVIGGVLPETGVTYYDVPQSFAMTPYRYTVVNGETVLVEPRTRRIVQIID